MGWARFVIVASNVIARHMIDDFKVPFDRIKLIPRGVDLNQFKFRAPEATERSEGAEESLITIEGERREA